MLEQSFLWFVKWKENSLFGRYITNDHIYPLIRKLNKLVSHEIIGRSVLGENIHCLTIGTGPNKILMWSQMHGNESTTTKAIFDLLNTLVNESNLKIESVLSNCTIKIIPILNPDGAKAYTRINANQVDLNRDAQDLSQPESRLLRSVFDKFQPDFCLNLHGQRTIFGAGNEGNRATISFLAPTQDDERTVTTNRKIAMQLINQMKQSLETIIPNQIGVYDDSFNINCVGDTFQHTGVPTILFEAGHYKDDYDREYTRYLIYHSYLLLLISISENSYKIEDFAEYFKIPQNEKCFYDIIIRNMNAGDESSKDIIDVALQYEEVLQNTDIEFIPKVANIGNLDKFYAHRELNAEGLRPNEVFYKPIKEGDVIDEILWKNEKLSLSPKKN